MRTLRIVTALFLWSCALALAEEPPAVFPDGGATPPAGPDAGIATPAAQGQGSTESEQRTQPRAPVGVPQMLVTPRLGGGPAIDLPPEDSSAATAPRAPSPGAIGTSTGDAERTSLFSDLGRKAEAIVNRTVIGGYGEFVFTKRRSEDSFFEARRLVAFLHSPIHERISFTAEIEFEHGGSPLKREGQLGAGEVQLEFAVLDIKLFEPLTLRAGIVLVPFGRFNINHDAPTQDLTDRPLALTYIVPSTWFEAGAGFFGRVRPSDALEINYEAYAINGLDSKIQDGLGYRAARGSKLQDNNDDKALVGRLGLSYFGKVLGVPVQLDLGGSGYTGAYNRRGDRVLLVGGDLEFRAGDFELIGEYVRGFNDAGFDDDYPLSSRAAVPARLLGLFVEAHYHVMPPPLRRVLPSWLRNSTFTLVARYDLIDTDMAIVSAGDRQRATAGLNYRFIEAVVWKHELQLDTRGGTNPFGDPRPGYVTSIAFLF